MEKGRGNAGTQKVENAWGVRNNVAMRSRRVVAKTGVIQKEGSAVWVRRGEAGEGICQPMGGAGGNRWKEKVHLSHHH